MIHKLETQQTEFKIIWKDDYLRQLCGFANSSGGKMYVGVNDKGEVIGIQQPEKLLEEIPNKVMNLMGIVVQVDLFIENNASYLLIVVSPSNQAISLRGKFYMRSGTTTQELNGSALQNFLLNKNQLTWDEIGVENATFADINQVTVKKFVELAISANRINIDARTTDLPELFHKLYLLDDFNRIKRAALLAFANDPLKFFPSMGVKIGRFLSETNIIVQDVIENNLFITIETVIDILKSKYLKSIISYNGIHREERLEVPEIAIREAVLNAIIHRDYTGAITQIRVNNNSLSIWNSGLLPDTLSIEMLLQQHASLPRNRTLANLFFKAGYIESWGRGTIAIAQECMDSGLTLPVYTEHSGGFSVEIFKIAQDTPQDTPQVTSQDTLQVKQLLDILTGEMTRDELQRVIGITNNKYFRQKYLKPALEGGYIVMTVPDKPNSKYQKYKKK
jgi:ATP-dependent DNA helicase RecG